MCSYGVFVLQIFLKEGILKKLSRKVMQPRMFFLVQYKLFLPLFIASTVLHNIIMIILIVLSHSHLVQNVFCADLNAIKCKSKKMLILCKSGSMQSQI